MLQNFLNKLVDMCISVGGKLLAAILVLVVGSILIKCLVKAIRKFKVDLGVRFSTYAVPMVMGEMRRFLRDDGSVSVGRRLKETAARAVRVQEKLRSEWGREPTLAETAQAMEISIQDLALSLESMNTVRSLDAPIGEERRRICAYLTEEITAMACSLPLHTVVPYQNVSKKEYPKNLPCEVYTRDETVPTDV